MSLGNKTLLECDDSWKKVIRYFEKHGSVMESVEFLSSMTNWVCFHWASYWFCYSFQRSL